MGIEIEAGSLEEMCDLMCDNIIRERGRNMERLNKFKAWLVENGIRQQEIADLLGITVQLTNAKINGREDFTMAQVRLLCRHYGISADNFFI